MNDLASSSSATAAKNPHLEGYVPRRKPPPSWLPQWVRKYIPMSQADRVRAKVNLKLWVYFTGRIKLQHFIGASAVGIGSWCAVCWFDGVSPYFAISEDPNTAFKHPHWEQMRNERSRRERELQQRVQSNNSSVALEHATRSYATQNANDRGS